MKTMLETNVNPVHTSLDQISALRWGFCTVLMSSSSWSWQATQSGPLGR